MLAGGDFLKEESGKLLVFKERECQIARARYLFYHAEEEKKAEATKLLRKRKERIQEKLCIFKKNIDNLKEATIESSSLSQIKEVLMSAMTDEQKKAIRESDARKVAMLPQMEQQYELLVAAWEAGNINFLLNVLGIEKIENPISFKTDDEDDMRVLKNAFGVDSINEADGDINLMYARMEVEQKYHL